MARTDQCTGAPYKHTQILGKAPETVVAAIEEVIRRSA